MNPKDFWWTEDQQVTVTNPTAEDYKFLVHGKAYMVPKGKVVKMPGYIAWLYVYNMGVKSAEEDGKFERWNDDGFRTAYFEKFVVSVEELISTVDNEPEPEVHTFSSAEEAAQANPAPGTGVNYTPSPKRGRPAKA